MTIPVPAAAPPEQANDDGPETPGTRDLNRTIKYLSSKTPPASGRVSLTSLSEEAAVPQDAPGLLLGDPAVETLSKSSGMFLMRF